MKETIEAKQKKKHGQMETFFFAVSSNYPSRVVVVWWKFRVPPFLMQRINFLSIFHVTV